MPLASTIDKQTASRSAFNTSSTFYTSTTVKPATSNPPDYKETASSSGASFFSRERRLGTRQIKKYIYQDTNKTNSGYIQPLGTPLFPGSTNDASHAK